MFGAALKDAQLDCLAISIRGHIFPQPDPVWIVFGDAGAPGRAIAGLVTQAAVFCHVQGVHVGGLDQSLIQEQGVDSIFASIVVQLSHLTAVIETIRY